MAIDPWVLIDAWWEVYNPMPTDPNYIESGKRAPLNSSGYIKYPGGVVQPVTKGNQQTGACQYWVNGLAPVCKLWDASELKCTFDAATDGGVKPSGYGIGQCDMLGRRSWCTRYDASKEYDPNEFACILPCVEKSGKGRQIVSENTMSFVPIYPNEIQGYNPDEDGIGRCDGIGMGRYDQGPFDTVEAAWEKPVVCRFYRPQIMGFGAYQPRPYHGSDTPGLPFDSSRNWVPQTTAELHDGSPADPLTYMDPRLPFSFQVYNSRAMFQKCAHWQSNRPAFFGVGSWGDNPHDFTIDLDEDPEGLCGCSDSSCDPYKTVVATWDPTLPPMLQYVWAEYGGVVCNGAKPECPCYSGDWLFCTDANMKDGMRISAEQIMELRFWASNWESKEEYDEFYQKKPGPTQDGYADETTSAIYTFKKWLMIDNKDPNKSKMIGVKVDLCQPAPLHMREFIPDTYLIREQIEYPTMDGYTGTNILGEGVLYPTLLRELDPPPDYIPDIFIVYPYMVKDPWDPPACDENEDLTSCIHDFNLMNSEPNISVVGYGAKESEIFVLNANFVEDMAAVKDFVDTYVRASRVPATRWDAFIEECDNTIDAADRQGAGMHQAVTSVMGFFHIDDVKLELNKTNDLYILCKYTDYLDDSSYGYTFRKVSVESRYWGALITQTAATHTPSESVQPNYFPEYYSPSIFMSGEVLTIDGVVDSVIPAYFLYVETPTGVTYAYYSYCINRHTETVDDVEKWAQVGPTGYIWAELDNIDINYLMDFTVTKATMTYAVEEDESGNRRVIAMCGHDPDDGLVLQVVYPSSGSNKDTERHTIPPNAVLLKAPNPLAFFNSKWKLSIEYTYNTFDTSPGDDVVWPVGMDGGYFSQNRFVNSTFSVQHSYGDKSFTIPSIGNLTTRGTAKVVAFITDQDTGRIQVAAASKLLMQGQTIRCKNVDIYYRYAADATSYNLQPSTGFFTWLGAPRVDPSTSTGLRHVRTAGCGDHLCGALCPPGYSWYPFNACSEPDFYNVLNGAAQCTNEITEGDEQISVMGPGAVRYGVAEEYKAWVTPGGNWASACGSAFFYHYSHAPMSNMNFVGKAYIRAKVDVWTYRYYSWSLPPFGNTGRESVERYLVRDFASHLDLSGPQATLSYRHMPMVVDVEDLQNQSLNCFETEDRYSLAGDPFSCFPMLSNYLSVDLAEEVSEQRLRWEEVVQVIHHGNCVYPWPLRSFGVQRYGFVNDSYVWLWPEYWKPIERNVASTNGEFKFIDVQAQDYLFDYVKEQHQFVIDEGVHTLVFEPPTGPDEDGEGDAEARAYPSVSIDGLFPRYFQIIYDEYDSQQVTWQDESDTGEEGASGGDGAIAGGKIYEKTCVNEDQGITDGAADGAETPAWIHDYNTIFGNDADEDTTDDRKAFISESYVHGRLYGHYNRGLIADIPRNRLYYLPMEEVDAGEGNGIFEDTDTSQLRTFAIEQFGLAPVQIVVVGDWGVSNAEEQIYSKAGITVREDTEEIELDGEGVPVWGNGDLVGSIGAVYGSTQEGVSRYTVTLDLPRRPERFVQTLNHFIVSLTPYGSETLKLYEVYAVLGKYTRAEEQIFVWERKFYPGVATGFGAETINADGTNTRTFRNYHKDNVNAGQYFPLTEDFYTDDPAVNGTGQVISKLNIVGVTEVSTTDEELDVTLSTLKNVELEAQRDLYEAAWELDDSDELNFVGISPPAIEEFLESVDLQMSKASNMVLSHYKTDWDHHPSKFALRQEGVFWQPGGHYFKWSQNFYKTRCYIFGPEQEVYMPLFIHNNHTGSPSTLNADEAYVGWGRLAYYEGKLSNMRQSGMFQEYATTDKLTGAKNGVYTESR